MIIKLIACEVFTREACLCVANSPHTIDVEFTPKGAHNDPDYFQHLTPTNLSFFKKAGAILMKKLRPVNF